MNIKLEEYKKRIKGKKVAVLGIGVSNTPLIKYLLGLGVDITAFDKSEEEKLKPIIRQFEGFGVRYSLGAKYLGNLKGYDAIFRSPGIRFDLPEVAAEVQRGAELTSEMEVFMELCPAQIFAVTGSDGKTTTTTIIYNMLKEQGYNCWLGGNIGTPLLSRIDEIKETDKVVLELSSFQLHTMKKGPDVAVVTNLSPNHLDIHKSMDEYINAKKNIFIHQDKYSKTILNYDNEITRSFGSEVKGKQVYFSRVGQLSEGAVLKDSVLLYRQDGQEKQIIKAEEIILPGDHNVENYLAAIAAVIDDVDIDTIQKVATTFSGVEHRIEPVRELNGIQFYNDSIGTSPTRTIASLRSFKQKVILIAGGYDKKIPYNSMGEVLLDKVKTLVLTGATAPKIAKALQDSMDQSGQGNEISVINCDTFDEAVKTAYKSAQPGDVVLMSPASASFDMFRNFEERGNRFKEIVNSL